MKILAIRGSNIASLEGSFEVDFEKPPLATAGLFAITGPTGAGKSTLLDVLCLGLFGETPRIKGGGNLEIPVTGEGDEAQKITAKDSRNLLRRGSVQGYAETDFRGVDGVKYRARWEVWRARFRPAGTLQPVRRMLSRIDTAPPVTIADGEKEVTAAVTRLLGLSFDQFRKAVLLAQGDFAAFLRASDQERADLLEKITGADIYTRVSKRAWEKGQGLSRALSEIEARIASLVPMEGEERRARGEEAARLTIAIEALEERRRRLEAAKGRARETADREREALEAAGRVAAKREARDARVRDAAEKEEEVRAAQECALAARGAREGRECELDAAKGLDARIDEKGDEARRAETDARSAGAERAAAEEAAGRLEEEYGRVRTTEAEAAGWLSERASTAPLVAQWERCERELEQLGERLREIGREASNLAEAALGEAAGATRVEAGAVKRAEAEKVLAKAEAAVGAAEDALSGIDRTALLLDGTRVSDEIGTLATLENFAAGMRQMSTRLETARRAGERERTIAAESTEAADVAAGRVREEEEHVALLQKARDAAAARRDLEDRRNALEPGQACPLCGSAEHPWAEPGAVPADRTAALETELAAKRDLLAGTAREETRRRADAANARRKAEEADEAAASADSDLVVLVGEWEKTAAGLPEGDPLGEAPADAARLEEVRLLIPIRLSQARSRLVGIRAHETEAVERDAEAGRARKSRDEASRRLESAREEVLSAERALTEAQGARALARTRLDAHERSQRELETELERFAAGEPGAPRLLLANPEALRSRWAGEVDEYRARETERRSAAVELRRLELERTGAASRLETAGRAAAERAERSAEAAAGVARLRNERASLLGGRSVVEVIEELDRAVSAADEALRVAAKRKAAADAERSATEAAVASAVAEETRVREIAAVARSESDAALFALGLPPGQEAVEELAAETAATIGRWKVADDERRRLAAALLADDVTREARRQAEEEKRRAEEGGKVWRQLSDLIGSASGNEFRKFAQGLTLRTLVTSANRHLEDLARRYRLVPAPGSELGLLVEDGDMGDELRSVESLSGGESFLVSLALALGLASLSTRSTAIGSLFIDEGFGSLDLETLKKAMAALDALQSKGRRIGVISHVHGLADEIGVQVKVVARGGGRSEVRVVGA